MSVKSFFILLIIIPILFSSCFVEQRIAYAYQDEIPTTSILFRNSAEVFVNNHKVYIPNNLSAAEKELYYDSAYYSSDLIQYIDIDDFNYRFNEYFLKSLRKKQLRVYTEDSITIFIKQNTPRMIIELVQIEIEEDFNYYYDETSDYPLNINTNKYLHLKEATYHNESDEDFNSQYFSVEIPRNDITVNSWFKIDLWYNDTTVINNTIFINYLLEDKIEGIFTGKNTQNVNYIYTIDSIRPIDLWKISEIPAEIFAKDAIDYLINTIIENRLYEKDKKPKSHWRLSDKSENILPTDEEMPYVIMD